MDDLLIEIHMVAPGPPVMLSQKKAVIRVYDEHGVFRGSILPVDQILPAACAELGRDLYIREAGFPGISLLSAHTLPGAVSAVISTSAILPIVLVIADQMAVVKGNTALSQALEIRCPGPLTAIGGRACGG